MLDGIQNFAGVTVNSDKRRIARNRGKFKLLDIVVIEDSVV